MANIPNNPTWAQIEAGLEGAGRAKGLASGQVRAAQGVIRAENVKLKVAKQNVARAEADLGQWLNAAQRKAEGTR